MRVEILVDDVHTGVGENELLVLVERLHARCEETRHHDIVMRLPLEVRGGPELQNTVEVPACAEVLF